MDLATRIGTAAEQSATNPDLLRGRYEPLEVVARGGQGAVLRAWDHQHDRAVALKVTPANRPEQREVMLAEARVLLDLPPHPNVVVIRDDFFDDDQHYLVMDWIPGEDLRTRLRREGAPGLPFDVVTLIVSDVAAALSHLHGQRPPVLHRDVKPANIVVSEVSGAPHAVLIDFGLATHEDQLASGATISYAAPEVVRDESATPTSDVYSLAATTFELLTGRVPTPDATLDWRAVPGDRVASVRSLLMEALAYDPAKRPPTVEDFAKRLCGVAGPPKRSALRDRPKRSIRVLQLVGALAVGAVLGATVLASADDDDDGQQAATTTSTDVGTGSETTAPAQLPADEARIGRIGLFTPRGTFDTYALGERGSVVQVHRQEGLTASWDVIVPITDHIVMFYRSRDAYVVFVDWTEDGEVLDLYAPSGFATGWTHLTPVRDGQLHLYNAADGSSALLTHDAEANITSVEPLPAARSGWSHIVSPAPGTMLQYDATTGDAALVELSESGEPSSSRDLVLDAGLTFLLGLDDGRVAVGDATTGSVSIHELTATEPSEAATETVDGGWDQAVRVGERLVVYNHTSGAATVLDLSGGGLETGPSADLLTNGAILIATL